MNEDANKKYIKIENKSKEYINKIESLIEQNNKLIKENKNNDYNKEYIEELEEKLNH